MAALLTTVRFLTTLPVPGVPGLRDSDWGQTTAWYPAVGVLLGAILAGLDWSLRWVWPGGVAAALLLVAWVVLTGALHLDGFVDCCDALLVPASRDRRLEILRDVHVGAFGLVGAVLLLLTKYAALAALPDTMRPSILILIPTLGRWGMASALLLYPYARTGPGLGRRAKAGAGRRQLIIATITALLVTALTWWSGLGWAAPLLLFLAALVVLVTAQWIQAKIGGLTGDVCGALCELVETVSLIALAALAFRGVWS